MPADGYSRAFNTLKSCLREQHSDRMSDAPPPSLTEHIQPILDHFFSIGKWFTGTFTRAGQVNARSMGHWCL